MERRANRTPALVASILLHVLVIGASLVSWPWKKEIKPLSVTPVTLLTSADLARLSAAEQSEVPTPAQTPEPDPAEQPAPIADTPAPQPQPAPAPKPAPQPAAKPTPAKPAPPTLAPPKPAPAPTKATAPAKPTPSAKSPPSKPQRMDLDALAASLAQNASKPAGAPRTSGARGLAQLERDLQARKADGAAKATTRDTLGLVTAKLIRLWNPNCGIEGADDIQIRVRISLDKGGDLAKRAELVDYKDVDAITDPVRRAAASRALSAVARGAPFEGLLIEDYDSWKQFIVRFDGKEACRGR